MTIQRNMLLSSLLLAGTYTYSMETNKGIFLTKDAAEKIKTEVKLHVDAKMQGNFSPISGDYMSTIITHQPIHSAFNALKASKKSKEHFDLFNQAVDRYVIVKEDIKNDQ